MQKLVKTGKDTEINKPMPSFGLIEENIELSHIHLAIIQPDLYSCNSS
jgi:hypothetical protein